MAARNRDIRPGEEVWRGEHAVLGGERLRLSVGGIPVALEGLDEEGRRTLAGVYGPFLEEPAEGPARLTVTFRRAPAERFLHLEPGEDHRVESRGEGERLSLWSYDFAGWFDPGGGEGAFLACPSDEGMFKRGVENYLRFLYSHLSLREGGFLLHAAGLVREGEAHLFLGPDGSGKTSITEASASFCEVLSDDLVLVVIREGKYCLAGVPFFGTFLSGRSSDQIHPLSRAWFLRRGEEVSVAPLAPGLQRARLMGAVSFLGRSPASLGRALDCSARFLEAHPVRLLTHQGDRRVWDGIEEWEESGKDETMC